MMSENTLGIYLHIPFCMQKCPYCDFYSLSANDDQMQLYTNAVCRFLKQTHTTLPVDTIYFGGGTPSLLPPAMLEQILQTIAFVFSLHKPEITLECNPATVTKETLSDYLHMGINRLSIGVQSFDEMQLHRLGRLHTAKEALHTIEQAATSGFQNLSCDVMLALPHQTTTELHNTLYQLMQLPIQHISAYLLKIEPNTPYAKSKLLQQLPDEDATADFYLQTVETLQQSGFLQYEISNFSKPGYESRHNCKYWRCEPYLGFGPSAHSCYAGTRFFVPSDLQTFCCAEKQPILIEDENPCTMEEKIMLGLRLLEGIPCNWLTEQQFRILKQCEKAGFIRFFAQRVAFTPTGCLVSNAILTEIL